MLLRYSGRSTISFPDGGRYYWKSQMVTELSDGLIDALLDCDRRRPVAPASTVFVRTLGGGVARVGPEETAFLHRTTLIAEVHR